MWLRTRSKRTRRPQKGVLESTRPALGCRAGSSPLPRPPGRTAPALPHRRLMFSRILAPYTIAFVALTGVPVLAAGCRQKARRWGGAPAVPAPDHVQRTIAGV